MKPPKQLGQLEQLGLFDDIYDTDNMDGGNRTENPTENPTESQTDNQKNTRHLRETSRVMPEIDSLIITLENQLIEMEVAFTPEQQSLLHQTFKQYLQTLIERRYFTNIDLYFAEFIAGQKSLQREATRAATNPREWLGYWLLLLLVSRAYGFGHTALPLTFLNTPKQWFIENDEATRLGAIRELLILVFGEAELPLIADRSDLSVKEYEAILSSLDLSEKWSPILANITMPLVLTQQGVYLDRNYQQESAIIDFFKDIEEMPLTPAETVFIRERLGHYFQADAGINWQKLAAANAILNQVSVISGGPGTGKTTTVFKILQTLVDLHHQRMGLDQTQPFTILLAAPTGKAAARLSESILGQIRQLSDKVAPEDETIQMAVRKQLELIPYKGQTLHRLLMIHPFTRKPKFNPFNPLSFDVLVVDEVSMIDQQMLVQLIGALPASGRVIFLGDKDQLASVEAGAIMHELCVQENYSTMHIQRLEALMGESLENEGLMHAEMPAFNYLSFLKKSYRFKSDSALGHLARIVNDEGNISNNALGNSEDNTATTKGSSEAQYLAIRALLKGTATPSSEDEIGGQVEIVNPLQLQTLPMEASILAKLIAAEFKDYLKILPKNAGIEFAEEAFKVFNRLGVLSARRTGEYGALALNELIRKTLFPRDAHREFFHGLPIMITHNSIENNLFNGDVGLILYNETGTLSAYFEGVDSARVFSIHSLPKFEPAFAMTIHKSQGSEFERIMLFLGVEGSAFLTKELFYTGITRAKKSVHIFASDDALKAALAGRVDRYSFIHTRLQAAQSK